MKTEIWKDIPGYEGYYIVSSLGRVYSVKKKLLKVPWLTQRGYHEIALYRNTDRKVWKVHRIVAVAFIPNPNHKPQVNHLDGNKINNRLDNLEWVTAKENVIHAFATGLMKRKNAA